jgi:hypothetical protein
VKGCRATRHSKGVFGSAKTREFALEFSDARPGAPPARRNRVAYCSDKFLVDAYIRKWHGPLRHRGCRPF